MCNLCLNKHANSVLVVTVCDTNNDKEVKLEVKLI